MEPALQSLMLHLKKNELSSVNRIYIRTNAKAGRKLSFRESLEVILSKFRVCLEYSFNNKDFYEAKQDFIIDTIID